MKITLVVDNPHSWIVPYANQLLVMIKKKGHRVRMAHASRNILKGDVAVFLSCERIVAESILDRNAHNLIVHESALPKGKGWSPLTWQILQGKNEVPVTLFEADPTVDSGAIYGRAQMRFKGHELLDELRAQQGKKTIDLIMKFFRDYPNVKGRKQHGRSTFYRRRRPQDSELDINKSLKQLFNQLRVADNERYPAFFRMKGYCYLLKIEKMQDE